MTTTSSCVRHRGFAKAACVWLLFWFGLGGFFFDKAAPKSEPVAEADTPALACVAPAAPPNPHTKNIEDVKAGDRVWAYDPQSGQWEAKQVLRPLTHEYAGDLVTVAVAGHTVQATGNHPFWVEAGQDLGRRPYAQDVPLPEQTRPVRGRWVDARHLEAGDILVLKNGGRVPIEMLTVRRVRQTVYNLKVADLHTYAVGDVGIAVHNKPCFPPGTLVLMGDGSTKAIEKIELGDVVLAKDPEAETSARPAEVSGLIRDFADGLVHVLVSAPNGTSSAVASSRFHPFWTQNRGWVECWNLRAGDVLENRRGSALTVNGVTITGECGRTFNLTVRDVHTFYVVCGDVSALVHNAMIPTDSSLWLLHGTTAPNANSIIQNGFTATETYFAETGSEASYFAFAKTLTQPGAPVRMLFQVPCDLANTLGIQRQVIGAGTGQLPVDIANGTGFEQVLPGSSVPAFNDALNAGDINVTIRPAFRS